MAGQPSVFDWAATIPIENSVAGTPLSPSYAIINSPNPLFLRAYFHCGGTDRVVRGQIRDALLLAATSVTFHLKRLDFIIGWTPHTFAGAIPQLPSTIVQSEFQGAGDLVGSGLDPTDDYYRTAEFAIPYIPPVVGTYELYRVLTVLRSGDVTAFDDSLVIQLIG